MSAPKVFCIIFQRLAEVLILLYRRNSVIFEISLRNRLCTKENVATGIRRPLHLSSRKDGYKICRDVSSFILFILFMRGSRPRVNKGLCIFRIKQEREKERETEGAADYLTRAI